jgi:hypothetical protein
MLIGNVRSAKDLSSKKELQKQLLDLEANNEAELQKRQQASSNKDTEVKKVQEQYRSPSEIAKDRANDEKKAIDNFIDLGFNYAEAGQLANWVSNENKLSAFNSGYKDIKKTILEKYDRTIITDQFIKRYLMNYFDDLEINLGKKFGRETSTESISDLYGVQSDYPSFDDVEDIGDTLFGILQANRDIASIKANVSIFENPKYSKATLESDIELKPRTQKKDQFIQYPSSNLFPLSSNIENKIALGISLLNKYQSIIPSQTFFNDAVISLSQNERLRLAKALERAFKISKVPTRTELKEIQMPIEEFKNQLDEAQMTGVFPNPSRFLSALDRLIRQLSSVGDDRTGNAFINFYNEYERSIDTKGDYAKLDKTLSEKQKQIENAYRRTIGDIIKQGAPNYPAVSAYGRVDETGQLISPSAELELEGGLEEANQKYAEEAEAISAGAKARKEAREQAKITDTTNYQATLKNLLKSKNKEETAEYFEELISFLEQDEYVNQTKTRKKGIYKSIAKSMREKYESVLSELEKNKLYVLGAKPNSSLNEDDLDFIAGLLRTKSQQYIDKNISYNPAVSSTPIRFNDNKTQGLTIEGSRGTFGIGTNPKYLKKLKKHFKGDEVLLKKVLKTLQDESSSSEEEAELNRHIKATTKVDKKIEKLVGNGRTALGDLTAGAYAVKDYLGLGFKATRIPVGKVGKGVKLEKEETPTYRQFGKYVIHLPYLLNNNVANFKYPSLGSIPSIKPLTISDDYKDLILETLQTGKLNKKELERLPQNEIKHFEKVAVGAGLVEQLGMKIGSTEEDKADLKRFEILRGEYLAGNNNEKMIKELRLLITKFINNGRIHKNEGLNLLLELSTL